MSADMAREEGPVLKRLYPWAAMTFLMILYTSSYVDRSILAILVEPIRADLQISDTQFGFLNGAAFVVFYTAASIPLGWLVDRTNRRNLIGIGVAVWSIMTAACGLANSYALLFLARVGVGVGEAALNPATYSISGDMFPRHQLARALSIFALGMPIGGGLAFFIGGTVVEVVAHSDASSLPIIGTIKPWQTVFLVVGLPGLILSVLTWVILREPARKKADCPEGHGQGLSNIFRFLWRNRKFCAPIFLGSPMISVFSAALLIWYPAYLQRVHGFSIGEAGMFLGLSKVILGIIGGLFSGWLADYYLFHGRTDAHMRVGLIYGIGLLICGVLGPLVPVQGLSLTLAAAAMFFSGTWQGVNAAALQLITPPHARGQVSAIYLMTANLISMTIGPLVVALSTDFLFQRDDAVGYSLALTAAIAVSIGCVFIYFGKNAVAARISQNAPYILAQRF